MVILLLFGMLAWGGGYIGAIGGLRAMIGHMTGAPKIMLEEYKAKGLTKCQVKGKIRWTSGKIEEGEWLIIGSEGSAGLALQAKSKPNKIIHLPESGKFLKARLQPDKEQWELIKLTGWATTEEPVYFLNGNKWYYAAAGELVWGQILGNNIKLFVDDG